MPEKINNSSFNSKETLHHIIRKHIFYFLPECIFFVGICIFYILVYSFFDWIISNVYENIFWIIFGIISILLFVLGSMFILKKMTKIHIITGSRIINPIQKEYFNFEDIDEIQSKVEGFWGNVFGFGTLIITLKNSTQHTIDFVPKVIETTRKIHSIISRKKTEK